MKILFEHQSNAIEKLKTFKVGALFMQPGTGKTRTAWELIRSVPTINRVIWLTPFQTKENLREELARCGELPNLEIVGIETLSASDRVYLDLLSKVDQHTFIVCDESLKIKNFGAKRTQRIINLGKATEYKLILNGTPLSKNVLDIWAQLEFLSPKILNMPLAEYKNTFVKYTTLTKKINGHKISKEIIDGYANIDYLYSLIKHYVYESDLILDVSQQYRVINYTVDDGALEKYRQIKQFMLDHEYMMFRNNNIFLEMIGRLQYSYCDTPDKIRVLGNLLNKVNLDETLVFCRFLRSKTVIEQHYPVRVLTYGKHAYGLNLQAYNTIIFFDKTFDYALRLQAERRIFRSGQTKPCTYYDLTGDVGLEHMIDRNIDAKISMLNYFKEVSYKTFTEQL